MLQLGDFIDGASSSSSSASSSLLSFSSLWLPAKKVFVELPRAEEMKDENEKITIRMKLQNSKLY